MLVLRRKPGEGIRVGPDIVVRLVRLAGNGARIGIEAPADVTILREELDDVDPPEERSGPPAE